MRISVDRDACMGCGICVLAAPAIFTQDDDGTVVLLLEDVPETERAAAEEAVMGCPAGAITLEF